MPQKYGIGLHHLCLLPYIASLFLPAFSISHPYLDVGEYYSGLYVLAWGIFGILDGTPAWLANPCFILSIAFWSSLPKISMALSLAAALLAATSFGYTRIFNDGDGWINITGMLAGFYTWWSAFIVLLLLNSYRHIRKTP